MIYILKYKEKEIGRVDTIEFMTLQQLINYLDPEGTTYSGYNIKEFTYEIIDSTISLAEYSRRHGKDPRTVRYKAYSGGFKTARKIGRNWVIDKNEPYIDNRIKSGQYLKWRDSNKR